VTDLYVYDLGEGRTCHLRVNLLEGGAQDVRLVVKEGSNVIVSPPLPDLQLRILASLCSGLYFDRTKRIVWPVDGLMLAYYEKEASDFRGGGLVVDIAQREHVPLDFDSEDPPQEEAMKPAPGRRRIV
jgi:hypothetical protein